MSRVGEDTFRTALFQRFRGFTQGTAGIDHVINHHAVTASDVADGLQLWFEQRAADGFIIQGGTPETFPRFVDEVVPLLQARGLFRRDYPGTTLRESLGLDLPINQFEK